MINKNFDFDNLVKKEMKPLSEFVDFHDQTKVVRKIKQATKKGYAELITPGLANLSFPDSKTRRGRVIDSGMISGTILTSCEIYAVESCSDRKLTPLECFKLMGFTENDFNKIKGIQ